MNFKTHFYEDESQFKVGDSVIYNKNKYTIKAIVDGKLELIDTTKTRGTPIIVDPEDIYASQLDLFGGGGSATYKERKPRSKSIKPDAEQISIF